MKITASLPISRLLLSTCLLALVSPISAQTANSSPVQAANAVSASHAAADNARRVLVMSNAKALAKNSQTVAAEQEVQTINRSKTGSAAWHMETAQRLLQVADQLAREGKAAPVRALANSALTHVNQADRDARDTHTRSAAKTLAGFIHERYLANPAAAIADYKAAADVSPTTANRAKEAASRLERTEQQRALRASRGK